MIQVIALRAVGYQTPREYELVLKDLDNVNKGYMQSTKYGTEAELTELLSNGGMLSAEIVELFAHAKSSACK
jgi:hypothetical protein